MSEMFLSILKHGALGRADGHYGTMSRAENYNLFMTQTIGRVYKQFHK